MTEKCMDLVNKFLKSGGELNFTQTNYEVNGKKIEI